MTVNGLVKDWQLRLLRQRQSQLSSGGNTKKKAKPVGYKLQNTFDRSLVGVPGGSMRRSVTGAIVKMVAAPHTGTRVVDKAPGTMKSMRNANTTSGSYNRTELRDQTGDVISNAQGRRR